MDEVFSRNKCFVDKQERHQLDGIQKLLNRMTLGTGRTKIYFNFNSIPPALFGLIGTCLIYCLQVKFCSISIPQYLTESVLTSLFSSSLLFKSLSSYF